MDRRTLVGRTAQTALAFGILRHVGACAPRERASDPGFTALRDRYFRQMLATHPVMCTYLGGDGYDPDLAEANGRLRNVTEAGIAAELAFLRETQTALEAIAPAGLNATEAVDHAVMEAQIAFQLRQLGERRYQQRALDTYVEEPFRGVDWQLQQMTDAGDGLLGTEEEWARVVQRVAAIPAYLEAARSQLAAGRSAGNQPDWRMIERDGIGGAANNATYFRSTLPATAAGLLGDRAFAPGIRARLAEVGGTAADAWDAFGRFLGATYDRRDRTDRFAAGEAEYAWRVTHCLRENRTPAELWEYGAAQVATYEEQMVRTAEEVAQAAGLGLRFDTADAKRASVRAVMDHLGQDAPASDAELFRWYRETGERAVAYGREQQLFAIPEAYRLDVVETPPVLRSSTDAAYYPAPPFKESGVGRFYLTPTGNDPAALKLNNRASVADTAVHEGFPGHDWHYKYIGAHSRQIANIRWLTPGAVEDSSSMWEDSMASEGWALYAEELMAEPVEGKPHGFYSAAEKLYELQGQLMRAVRVRVDVGIHTGRMTFDEAMDYFAEHVDFYPGARLRAATDPVARAVMANANRAIYRYSKWPTQAITYNLGKRAILDLREALREQHGARFSARAFHERFMAMGTIPAGYFRGMFLAD